MPSESKRVTVTLPADLVEEIDRLEKNRSKFVLAGVRRELRWRRRAALRRSLRSPHPDTAIVAEEGFEDWVAELAGDHHEELVDPREGEPVRWAPGEGWQAREEDEDG